ncbi:MAG: alpha/beta hydrolase [Chloroflexota bacterium]
MRLRPRWRWLWALPLLLLLALGGFTLWAYSGPGPDAQALAALGSDAQVTVENGKWLLFSPTGAPPTTGLIFYPGGRVDHRAYAPPLRAIAAQGYLVVNVPMPLRLAVLAPDAAAEVMAAYPGVRSWAVAGHSLGGSMAARFARGHPAAARGLALWAAYPDTSDDLSRSGLAVVSISGERDGLATPAKIAGTRALLPADSRFVAIPGGNHAQFGAYGPQDGDNAATLSVAAQQALAVDATVALLRQIER